MGAREGPPARGETGRERPAVVHDHERLGPGRYLLAWARPPFLARGVQEARGRRQVRGEAPEHSRGPRGDEAACPAAPVKNAAERQEFGRPGRAVAAFNARRRRRPGGRAADPWCLPPGAARRRGQRMRRVEVRVEREPGRARRRNNRGRKRVARRRGQGRRGAAGQGGGCLEVHEVRVGRRHRLDEQPPREPRVRGEEAAEGRLPRRVGLHLLADQAALAEAHPEELSAVQARGPRPQRPEPGHARRRRPVGTPPRG
mmetsp:Transcript_49220/g.111658  ORF Transcript_49220/g.111658 Transcript_49220/m.111658 type:complete len:258 (+) Transcript_49220:997-1770(+)